MEAAPLIPMSPREREVLRTAAEDHATNAEVASRLFISVRTVESHIASLLRKTGAQDRRALLRMAPELLSGSQTGRPFRVPMTPLIGREHDRSLVAAAIEGARLVTIVGPGGSGKTALALDVLRDVAVGRSDTPIEVDLTPITDAARVPSTIVARLGIAERGAAASVLADRFRTRRGLVLLDNCEHLGDALAGVLEDLLSQCPGLSVLATSRSRFGTPFETVVRIEGLAPDAAVSLFTRRAVAAGAAVEEIERSAAEVICRRLDGMPLAVELAAAQVPVIGLDGVQAAIADPLALLAGARGSVPRHSSMRATLQWSHELLGPVERAVLRRLAVLTVPFPAAVAEAVAADWEPVAAGNPRLLGALVDASLLSIERGVDGARYRLHEVVRRFAAELAGDAGEAERAEDRLLEWCAGRLSALSTGGDAEGPLSSTQLAVLLSAVEGAASRRTGPDVLLSGLARALAAVRLAAGGSADAQRLLQVAAAAATDAAAAAEDLTAAAAAAEAHAGGDAAVSLRRSAAVAWEAAGAESRAAEQLARAAELINRAPGFFVVVPPSQEVEELLVEARRMAGDDPQALHRVLTATSFTAVPDPGALAQRAAVLARRAGDVAGESAALDAESSAELVAGRPRRAYDIQLQRVQLLEPVRTEAGVDAEYEDALQTAADCALAVGDLRSARRFALLIEQLPSLAEQRHLAVGPRMVVDALRGVPASVMDVAPGFLASWDRAGRPAVGALSSSAYAAATMYALEGDDASAERWRSVSDDLFGDRTRLIDFERATFDLLVLLHRGELDAAVSRAWSDPGTEATVLVAQWVAAHWRPWYTALRAEAAVLARARDAAAIIEVAPPHLGENPVATALLDRAAALLAGDAVSLTSIAERFDHLDAPYQAARTRFLAATA